MLVNKINYTTPNFKARIIIDKKNIELMASAAISAGTTSSTAASAIGSEMEAIAHAYNSNIGESAREICENSPLRNSICQLQSLLRDAHDPLANHLRASTYSSLSGSCGFFTTKYHKSIKSKNIPS